MKLLVQWSTIPRTPLVETTASRWRSLPKKPVPLGGETLDAAPGWITALVCHGLTFSGADHIAVEDIDRGGVRITSWSDDPEDHDERSAYAWRIYPLRRDPQLGTWNTEQYVEAFAEGATLLELRNHIRVTNSTDPWTVREWSEFVPPDEALTRHGIWLPNADYEESFKALIRTPRRSWRTWTDGVPAEDIRNGEVIRGR